MQERMCDCGEVPSQNRATRRPLVAMLVSRAFNVNKSTTEYHDDPKYAENPSTPFCTSTRVRLIPSGSSRWKSTLSPVAKSSESPPQASQAPGNSTEDTSRESLLLVCHPNAVADARHSSPADGMASRVGHHQAAASTQTSASASNK